jgi:micrococcal nuclease
VASITDGDTIRAIEGVGPGPDIPVRFIGIDTPEIGEACYDEATAAMTALVEFQILRMDVDVSETDAFDRLLRYVFLLDGTFVNAEMVRQGWAMAADYPPDTAYAFLFTSLEEEARAYDRGIWGNNCSDGSNGAGGGGSNCDPSYPTVCIPSPPPDLDCGDIPERNFTVIGSDPHRFDGDNDGIGCET